MRQVFAEDGVSAGGQRAEPVESDHGAVPEPRRQTDAEPIAKSLSVHLHTDIHARAYNYDS